LVENRNGFALAIGPVALTTSPKGPSKQVRAFLRKGWKPSSCDLKLLEQAFRKRPPSRTGTLLQALLRLPDRTKLWFDTFTGLTLSHHALENIPGPPRRKRLTNKRSGLN